MRIEIKSNILGAVTGLVLLFIFCWKLDAFAVDVESRKVAGERSMEINAERISELVVGASYSAVIEKMGEPSNDDVMYKKTGGDAIGRRLLYIVDQADHGSFNAKKDKYLRLWFGPDDKLLEIDPHEIK